MLPLELLRDTASCLADDLHLAFHCRLEHFVPRVVMKRLICNELPDLEGRFEHVSQ